MGTARAVKAIIPPEGTSKEFSDRQKQILQFIADGKTNADMAQIMSTAEQTMTPNAVQMQVNVILNEIGTSSRSAAVAWALRKGLIK